MIAGIQHMALSVADIARSVEFYRDVLGFSLVRTLECEPEGLLGRVTGIPNCRARIAHLVLGQIMLELFEYIQPAGQAIGEHRSQADHGWIHMGLRSSDTRADYRRLRETGIEFISAPVEFRPDVWVVYFKGPDGEVLELRQTPPEQNEGEQ